MKTKRYRTRRKSRRGYIGYVDAYQWNGHSPIEGYVKTRSGKGLKRDNAYVEKGDIVLLSLSGKILHTLPEATFRNFYKEA